MAGLSFAMLVRTLSPEAARALKEATTYAKSRPEAFPEISEPEFTDDFARSFNLKLALDPAFEARLRKEDDPCGGRSSNSTARRRTSAAGAPFRRLTPVPLRRTKLSSTFRNVFSGERNRPGSTHAASSESKSKRSPRVHTPYGRFPRCARSPTVSISLRSFTRAPNSSS